GESARHRMVAVTQDYFPFGYGKHSCGDTHPFFHNNPGRFLAANELQTTPVHIVMSYDVKFEDSISRPTSIALKG
ncbi:hypothetical protein EDD16DRAFT_1423883, partial [Pisolithus croceorrhizus]